jgi:hypothetical protein
MTDAGRYRHVLVRTWLDPAFTALSPSQKVVALYLLTGPPTNNVGLYRLSLSDASEDFKTPRDTFRRQFTTVLKALDWRYDDETRLLWIPEWLTINAPQSPNVVKGWGTTMGELPDCPLKAEALLALQRFIHQKGPAFQEAFAKAFPMASSAPSAKTSVKPPALTPSPSPERERLPREQASEAVAERELVTGWRAAPAVGDDSHRIMAERQTAREQHQAQTRDAVTRLRTTAQGRSGL